MKLLALSLCCLVGLWALTAWLAARAEKHIEAAYPPEGTLIEVNGSQMHYVARGQGPDLVLIHGSNGSTRDLTFKLADMLASDYRVIMIDRPGLGYSTPINPAGDSITEQARQIADTAAALGAEKPIVLGHSYGGAVALAWAAHMPDRLSALVPAATPSHPWDTPLDALYAAGSHTLLGPVMLPLLPALVSEDRLESAISDVFKPDTVPTGYFEHFGPQLSLRHLSMQATAHQRANLLSEIKALEPHYAAISVPVEIIHGTEDTTVGLTIHAKPLLADVPSARLTPLEGHGHMILHSASQAVVAAIHRAAQRAGLRTGLRTEP